MSYTERVIMAASLLQVRVEDSLKDKATQVFEKLGMNEEGDLGI